MSTQGSLIHVGSKGKPTWSNPTEEHTPLKLLVAMIERCQVYIVACSAHANPCSLLEASTVREGVHQNWTMEQ